MKADIMNWVEKIVEQLGLPIYGILKLETFNLLSSSYPHWCCLGSCALSICWQCVLVFKSVARYAFAFEFLLDSSLVVLWYSEEWWHVCKFLCINLWFQYPCEVEAWKRLQIFKDTLRFEDRNIRMIEFESKTYAHKQPEINSKPEKKFTWQHLCCEKTHPMF
jgi:hypothetical protein